MARHEVIIKDFGPVKEAKVDLNKDFQILIGVQASGKSTICKVVYFCQKIRDYTLDFLMDAIHDDENQKKNSFEYYQKYLTKQFMLCFGKISFAQEFTIEYYFNDSYIMLTSTKDGYAFFEFDDKLRLMLLDVMKEVNSLQLSWANMISEDSAYNRVWRYGNKLYQSYIWGHNHEILDRTRKLLKKDLAIIFGSNVEILYIPAGRSLLATMSEQLSKMPLEQMDMTMREFIRLIEEMKKNFSSKIPEMVRDFQRTEIDILDEELLEQAYCLIRRILKADYTSDSDGEKIYFDEKQWVKLIYGSSGQQEALWILLLVFNIILRKQKVFMVIEEPEAHLFPVAQKDMISLISLMVNSTGSKVILTTHSPYILTSANILLYSDKVETHQKEVEKMVVAPNVRIKYDDFDAFVIGGENKPMESLLDEESHMVSTRYIDEVSAITNSELEQLIDMEIENDL